MVDRERSHRVLTELRGLGMRVSIDDFGTGYSSLAYLKQIPADELKIDKSFVMNMLTYEADGRIVEQIVALGHAFGLEVVAEGVESEAVAAKLAAMGCDYAQGFHYAKPLPAKDFPAGPRTGASPGADEKERDAHLFPALSVPFSVFRQLLS